MWPTVVEAVGDSHHVDWHSAAISTVEHPLLCQFWVKGNFPEPLEVERIKEDEACLISQRSRLQEFRDKTCRRDDQTISKMDTKIDVSRNQS